VIIKFILISGDGFCDYEEIDTVDRRGVYFWSESTVGSNITRACVFNPDLIGFRVCIMHLGWADADLSNCITRDTLDLRMLSVSLF